MKANTTAPRCVGHASPGEIAQSKTYQQPTRHKGALTKSGHYIPSIDFKLYIKRVKAQAEAGDRVRKKYQKDFQKMYNQEVAQSKLIFQLAQYCMNEWSLVISKRQSEYPSFYRLLTQALNNRHARLATVRTQQGRAIAA